MKCMGNLDGISMNHLFTSHSPQLLRYSGRRCTFHRRSPLSTGTVLLNLLHSQSKTQGHTWKRQLFHVQASQLVTLAIKKRLSISSNVLKFWSQATAYFSKKL